MFHSFDIGGGTPSDNLELCYFRLAASDSERYIFGQLGRGLMAGQRFLVAQIVGSNPTVPANYFLKLRHHFSSNIICTHPTKISHFSKASNASAQSETGIS